MSVFRLTRRAEADLRDIWEYIGIERQAPNAADQQLKRLHKAFALLATQPLLGQLRTDLRPALRVFSVGNYAIAYYPQAYGIDVIAVEHGARDIDARIRENRE
jgi:plasmid stabilization system protein ParE